MLGPLPLVLGLALLTVALVDLLWTALWITGKAGPVSGWLLQRAWQLMLRAAGGRHHLLSLFGPLSLVAATILWSAMLWVGWALVFSADAASVRDADSGAPGDFGARLYFTGYAIFTMGNGDIVPAPGWRIPSVLTNATGLVLLTLVVSYLISVLSAVASSRSFGHRVASLGGSAEAILLAGRDDDGFGPLEGPLSSFANELSRLGEQQAAYPVLRYFHASERGKAVPPAVATLDDVLTILEAVPHATAPSRMTRLSLAGAIEGYLGSFRAASKDRTPEAPPAPQVGQLRGVGLGLDEARLSEALERASGRRAALARVLRSQGWPWPEAEATGESR